MKWKDFGVRIDCVVNGKFCGKCCYQTEMPLTKEDIERIERLGYRREDFAIKVNGVYRLRNVNGKCYFLDESNRCVIYDHRPIGCRIYPIIFDITSNRAIVDDLCPRKDKISKRELKIAEKILRRLVKEIYHSKILQ